MTKKTRLLTDDLLLTTPTAVMRVTAGTKVDLDVLRAIENLMAALPVRNQPVATKENLLRRFPYLAGLPDLPEFVESLQTLQGDLPDEREAVQK